MELGTGLGGIALIALAVVWLLIFVPGWAKKSQLSANPELVSEMLPQAAAKDLVRSVQVDRLMRTRRIFSLTLFGALVVIAGWFAIPTLAAGGMWVPLASGSLAVLSLVMLIAANRTRRQIAVRRIQARNVARERIHQTLPSADLMMEANATADQDSGWQPNPLPAPLSAPKVGALISPKVADVIPIKAQEENSEQAVDRPTIELDEILRRRRVI